MKTPKMFPEEILSAHTPEVKLLTEMLRRLILDEAPEAVEKAYPGWHAIGYTHPKSGYFCAIFPLEDRIQLAFEYGVLLRDPARLLIGQGKQVRYFVMQSAADVLEQEIRSFIKKSLALPESRAVKLSLIEASARSVNEDD